MATTVTTQAELDKALADKASTIYIESTNGVWLYLPYGGTDSSHVVARGSSRVEAWDSSRVEAWGSSRVVAWDSSHVEAWDSSHVVARDSSHVEAWGSSHVEAWDSSHVEAWDSSHVEAGKFVAVHLHSQRVNLEGGVVIDMTAVDYTDLTTWVDANGCKSSDDGEFLIVYKGTFADGATDRGFKYEVGSDPLADDKWRDDNECGGGLHFCPSASATRYYIPGAERYFRCRVRRDEARAIGSDKLKAPRVWVDAEVDMFGDEIKVGG